MPAFQDQRNRPRDFVRILAAEAVGCGLLSFIIAAAGIVGERFAIQNIGVAVMITALAGAAAFAVLARSLGHLATTSFNPALALALILDGRMSMRMGVISTALHIASAILGVMLAHLVTNTGVIQTATQIQTGAGVWLGEFVGTALFVLAALSLTASPDTRGFTGAFCLLAIALATPSTSFANPAISLARALTDSFTSIRLADALVIAGVQILAALFALALWRWVMETKRES